jgi:hypothetical protein
MDTNVEYTGNGLAIICQWNAKDFGQDSNTSPNIQDHWFVLEVLDTEDYMNPYKRLDFYKHHYKSEVYLHLVNYYYLPGKEIVGICKTFWLKLVQRKWKKVYVERMRVINLRKKSTSILYHEKYGKWPSDMIELPGIRGMLCK